MCLAIPALINSVDGSRAEADMGGIRRSVSILLTPDVEPGDYVLVHAGYAINTLDKGEAEETLRLFQEINANLDSEE